jgi:ribonuclease HI
VEAVEALVAKGAIQFALEIGIMEDEFEGDSETIVKALKDVCPSHTTFGLIIEDVRALSSNLEKVHFNHIKHQGNSIPHALARHAQYCADLEVWMESVPLTIELSQLNIYYLLIF